MKLIYSLFILFHLCSFNLYSQSDSKMPENFKLHTYYIEKLKIAKDAKYDDFLNEYDELIARYPSNILIKIERCKLIGNAYYDEYDDYNLKYDEHEQCLNDLYANYSHIPEVILYKAEYSYGDDLALVLNKGVEAFEVDKTKWSDDQISQLYYILAEHNYDIDENAKALRFIKKAQKYNDSLDYSILSSNIYIANGHKDVALRELLNNLNYNYEDEVWKLNQKANILLELNNSEKALETYDRIAKIDSTYIDNSSLSEVFVGLGKNDIARQYLVKDTINSWNKSSALSKLLIFDLKYSDGRTTINTYRRVQNENFSNDIFSINRLKIFFKFPSLSWQFSEVLLLLILLITIAVIFIIPYIWVLPIYFIGNFKLRKKIKVLRVPFDWSLKHFWGISFFYLLVSFIIFLIFNYGSIIDIFSANGFEVEEESNALLAKSNLFFLLGMFIVTALFFNIKRIKYLYTSKIRFLRILSLSIVFVVVNILITRVLKSFVDVGFFPMMDIKDTIMALISEYSFSLTLLIIAIIVPIYEEVIFRGIIFSATEKYIGFWKANIVQATLFATIHQSLSMFIFYFIFAIILGIMVRKSKGLLVGIIFHSLNNLLATYAIYSMMKVQNSFEELYKLGFIEFLPFI